MADKVKRPSIDLSGLSDIASMVTGMQNPDLNTRNGYFEISLAKIREDPNQPRREFDAASIEELALSIEENGLKQPIAIREDGDAPGRYIVCQGARRLRAYRLRKWEKIPAVFDPRFSRTGQVIENIQRQPLTPQEIAAYLKDELATGKSIRQIAKGLGKSPAFVFLYKNLLDIKPPAVKKAWDSGKIQDIQVLNDLMHLGKDNEQEVEKFVAAADDEITRPSVRAFKKDLAGEMSRPFGLASPQAPPVDKPGQKTGKTGDASRARAAITPGACVFVEYRGETAVLLLREAGGKKKAAIQLPDGSEREVSIQDLVLLRVARV